MIKQYNEDLIQLAAFVFKDQLSFIHRHFMTYKTDPNGLCLDWLDLFVLQSAFEQCSYRIGVQHCEEVRAGEELGTGGLEQQGDVRPGTSLSHGTVPPELWKANAQYQKKGNNQEKMVLPCGLKGLVLYMNS